MSDYQRLEMTASAYEGSFVRTLQGQTGTGFAEGTHVHKDWYAKTISYDQALDLAEDAARQREDIMVKAEDIVFSVSEDGQFMLALGDKDYIPTDHALQQMSIRLGVPSSSVLRELRNLDGNDFEDSRCMVNLARNALRRIDGDKVFRVRTYTDGTCRAFVSDRYAPVDNRWYLETLREFLPEGRLSHWRGNEDTLYGNIILPDSVLDYGQGDDSDYGGMLSVSNCEVATRVISQRPSLFRSICMNGCIWGQVQGRRINRRHIGAIDLESLKTEIAENIALQLPLLPAGIHKFLELKKFEIESSSMMRMIAAVCDSAKMKRGEASEVLTQWREFEDHEANLFGVLNAVTRAGQVFDNPTWVAFDELGGKLVDYNANNFGSLVSRANSLTDKELEKIYAVAV